METTKTADHSRSITKSALSFLSGTMISRVSGMCRDISMAYCFGTGPAVAAFIVAFRFASLLRRIFGEGALLTSFIPHFESHRGEERTKASFFFRDTFFSLFLILVLIIGAIELGLYSWISFAEVAESNRQIIQLTMVMLPSLLFLCLYSICSGLLQCEKKYFLPGAAPIAFNLVWIAAIWYYRDLPSQTAMMGLSIAVVGAALLQWLVTFPKTLSYLLKDISWKDLFRPQLLSPEIKLMLTSISLGVIGVSAAQVNGAIDTLFARYSSLEGPAYLNFAIHLQQLPLALFGISVSSALLPPLSRAIRSGELTRYQQLLHFALSNTLLLLLPCSFAIFALGGSSVNLIYGHGDFANQSAVETTYCLWGYGIGLLPMAMSLLLTPAFHARKDFLTPTIGSLISIGVNIMLNSFFIFICNFGAASLAYSTSLAASFNCAFLFYKLSQKEGIHLAASIASLSVKTAICSGLAALTTLYLGHHLYKDPTIGMLVGGSAVDFTRIFKEQLLQFGALLGIYLIAFYSAAALLRARELFSLFRGARAEFN